MANDVQRLALTTVPSDPGRLCFADEVGIDFPSLRAAVVRIRDGFLGSGADTSPVQAHLTLSPDDARDGREVLLALPVRRTCTRCGGRGETWNDACDACCGLGDALDHRNVSVSVPPGVRDGTRVRLTVHAHALVTHVDVCISVR